MEEVSFEATLVPSLDGAVVSGPSGHLDFNGWVGVLAVAVAVDCGAADCGVERLCIAGDSELGDEGGPAEEVACDRPTVRDVGDNDGRGDLAHIPRYPFCAVRKEKGVELGENSAEDLRALAKRH